MIVKTVFFICCITAATTGSAVDKRVNLRRFPDDFKFGVATAAYQIEGAWNQDGKGLSMWDHLVRTDPSAIVDNSTGDIAANSYYLYETDIELLKNLGVKIYRFSISWTRILPNGCPDYINPQGIAHYNNLIDSLIENGIIPFVTIYHWDFPQSLSEQGGWLNPKVVDWFGDYARIIFTYFGDRVKNWLTINEPHVHCLQGYGLGHHAPQISSPGVGFYKCNRNILLAHATAYHIYQDSFKAIQNGEVSLVLSADWSLASTDSADDKEAVEDYLAFNLGIYADPIYSANGNYPQLVIDRVAANSANQGLNASRLQPFTPEEVEYIRGTADFFALNHYSTDYVYRNESLVGEFDIPSLDYDIYVGTYKDPSWPTSASPWLTEYAPGFHSLLVYLKNTYNNPIIYVTENGFSTGVGLQDDSRVQYLRNYLTSVLDALDDGVDVRGYCAWSLMDNFEWNFGYTRTYVDQQDKKPRGFVYKYKFNSD